MGYDRRLCPNLPQVKTQICRKSKSYIESIIKDYGLFDYNDAIFVCKIVSRSFAIESSLDSPSDDHEDCMISTRTRRADMSARSAQKDNDNHNKKENKEKVDVRVSDDTHSTLEEAAPATDYRSYEKYLKR